MDQYQLIAALLWSGFVISLIALIAGVNANRYGSRNLALSRLLISVLGTLAFSFIGGFSIGRFSVVIPVLAIGYVAGMGRGPVVVVGCLFAAALAYLACSWIFTPLVLTRSPLSLVFGFWAIPLYAVLAVAAFGLAFARPPSTRHVAAP